MSFRLHSCPRPGYQQPWLWRRRIMNPRRGQPQGQILSLSKRGEARHAHSAPPARTPPQGVGDEPQGSSPGSGMKCSSLCVDPCFQLTSFSIYPKDFLYHFVSCRPSGDAFLQLRYFWNHGPLFQWSVSHWPCSLGPRIYHRSSETGMARLVFTFSTMEVFRQWKLWWSLLNFY